VNTKGNAYEQIRWTDIERDIRPAPQELARVISQGIKGTTGKQLENSAYTKPTFIARLQILMEREKRKGSGT